MALIDYFLKIDGIDGESLDDKHKGEIVIESWSWGETRSVPSAGGAGGAPGIVRAAMQDFHFVMPLSKASLKLALACATGQLIKSAVLTCRRAGREQQEFLKITLGDLVVTAFHTGGSLGGDAVLDEQVSLAFLRIQFEYREQKPDGTLGVPVTAGWDVKANRPI